MSDGWRKIITSYTGNQNSRSDVPMKKVIRDGKIVEVPISYESNSRISKGGASQKTHKSLLTDHIDGSKINSLVSQKKYIHLSNGMFDFKTGINTKNSMNTTNHDTKRKIENSINMTAPSSQRSPVSKNAPLKLEINNVTRKIDANFKKKIKVSNQKISYTDLCSHKIQSNIGTDSKTKHNFNVYEKNANDLSSEDFMSDPNAQKFTLEEFQNCNSEYTQNLVNNKISYRQLVSEKIMNDRSVTGEYLNNLINSMSGEKGQFKDNDELICFDTNKGVNDYLNNFNAQNVTMNLPNVDTDIDLRGQSDTDSHHAMRISNSIDVKKNSERDVLNEVDTVEQKSIQVDNITRNKMTIEKTRLNVRMAYPGVIIVTPSSKTLCDVLSKFHKSVVRYNPKGNEWVVEPSDYSEIRLSLKKFFNFDDIPSGLLRLYIQVVYGCEKKLNIATSSRSLNINKPELNNRRNAKKVENTEFQYVSNKSRSEIDKITEYINKNGCYQNQTLSDIYGNQVQSHKSSKIDFGHKRGVIDGSNIDSTFINLDSSLKQLKNGATKAFLSEKNNPVFTFNTHKTFQNLKVPLLDFQKAAVAQAVTWGGRILFADEMGLGKTLQALSAAIFYKAEWPCLVLSPASLVGGWVKAFKDFAGIDATPVRDRKDLYEQACVCSYDMAAKFLKTDYTFRVIIADEAHYLKNPKSARSLSLLSVLQRASRVFLLSGTPATSRPCELYTSLVALRPGAFKGFREFGLRYCTGHRKGRFEDWRGCSNSSELLFFLNAIFMIRRTKADVLNELPTKSRVQVVLETSKLPNLLINENQKDDSKHSTESYYEMCQVVSSDDNIAQERGNEFSDHKLFHVSDSFVDIEIVPQSVKKQNSNIASNMIKSMNKNHGESTIRPEIIASNHPRNKDKDQNHSVTHYSNTKNAREVQINLSKYFDDLNKSKKTLGKPEKPDKNILHMYNDAAHRKLPTVIRYIRRFLKRDIKTVIFAQHHMMLDGIQESIRHIKHIRIDGKTPVQARQKMVESFQEDPEIRIALLSITTCGTGLTLTAATAALFTELYWNPGSLLQAEDRIHRIGQTKPVTIYYLTATKTVDEIVWPLLTKKMGVLERCGVGKNEFKDIKSDDGCQNITDFCTIEKFIPNNDNQ